MNVIMWFKILILRWANGIKKSKSKVNILCEWLEQCQVCIIYIYALNYFIYFFRNEHVFN